MPAVSCVQQLRTCDCEEELSWLDVNQRQYM